MELLGLSAGANAALDPLEALCHGILVPPEQESLHSLLFALERLQELSLVPRLPTVEQEVQVTLWDPIPLLRPKAGLGKVQEAAHQLSPQGWDALHWPVVGLAGNLGVVEDTNVLGLGRVLWPRDAAELAQGRAHDSCMQAMRMRLVGLLCNQGDLGRNVLAGVVDDAVKHLASDPVLDHAGLHDRRLLAAL